jgi:hypothetical protein
MKACGPPHPLPIAHPIKLQKCLFFSSFFFFLHFWLASRLLFFVVGGFSLSRSSSRSLGDGCCLRAKKEEGLAAVDFLSLSIRL